MERSLVEYVPGLHTIVDCLNILPGCVLKQYLHVPDGTEVVQCSGVRDRDESMYHTDTMGCNGLFPPLIPGPTFIKPDQRNPWIKDQL